MAYLVNPLILVGQRCGGGFVKQRLRLGHEIIEADRFDIGEHAMEATVGRSPTRGVVAGRKDDAREAQCIGDVRHSGVIAYEQPCSAQQGGQSAQVGSTGQIEDRHAYAPRHGRRQFRFARLAGEDQTQAAPCQSRADTGEPFQRPTPLRYARPWMQTDILTRAKLLRAFDPLQRLKIFLAQREVEVIALEGKTKTFHKLQ